MRNKIGVVLTCWNYPDETIECLKSFEQCEYDYLVVVDNNSTEMNKQKVKSYLWDEYKKHSFFNDLDRESCLSRSLNVGVETLVRFEASYIAWIHTDMKFPDPLWLHKLRNFLQENPEVGKVAPTTTVDTDYWNKQAVEDFHRGNSCPWLCPTIHMLKIKQLYGNYFDERYEYLDFEDWDFNNRMFLGVGHDVVIYRGTKVDHPGAGYKFKPEMVKYYGKVRKQNHELFKKIWQMDKPVI